VLRKLGLSYNTRMVEDFRSLLRAFGPQMKYPSVVAAGALSVLLAIGCSTPKRTANLPKERFTLPNGSEFVKLEPLSFDMGSDVLRGGYVRVKLTPFYIQSTEVTNVQFEKVMGKRKRHPDSDADNEPVSGLSIKDIKEYIKRLSKETGKTFRLPTSAEFEYAARSGYERMDYPWGPEAVSIEERARTSLMTRKDGTVPVKSFPSNYFGLHEVVGNVRDVVLDTAYGVLMPRGEQEIVDPQFVDSTVEDTDLMTQGGGFRDTYPFVWSLLLRDLSDAPDIREYNGDVGFRLVMSNAKLRRIEVPSE